MNTVKKKRNVLNNSSNTRNSGFSFFILKIKSFKRNLNKLHVIVIIKLKITESILYLILTIFFLVHIRTFTFFITF